MVRRHEAAVEDVVVRQRAAQDAVKGEHLDGHPEVLHVVGVEERVDGGVEMAQDDGDIHDERRHSAAVTEGLHAVNGVKREPTEHEEQHDDAQAFGGFDLPPVGVAHLVDDIGGRAASARVQPCVVSHLATLTPTHEEARTLLLAALARKRPALSLRFLGGDLPKRPVLRFHRKFGLELRH